MKKNLTLISLMLGVMLLVSVTGIVSAATLTANPDYAYCNMDGSDSSGVCTSVVSTDGSGTKVMDQGESVDAKWDSSTISIPSGAVITDVRVMVKAEKEDTNSVWVAKWDGTALTPSQSWIESGYETKTFSSGDLKNYVTSMIGSDQKLEVKISGTNGPANLEIDHIWLEIDYTEQSESNCQIIVTHPSNPWYNGIVPVEWTFSQDCLSDDWDLAYKEGSCNPSGTGWESFLDTVDSPQSLDAIAENLNENSQYCIKVEGDNHGEEVNFSSLFKIDKTVPEVNDTTFTCYEGNYTTISIDAEDSLSGIASYSWENSETGSSFSYYCADGPNTETFEVTVTDNAGNSNTGTATVNILNVNPWNVDGHGSGYHGIEGVEIQFTGTANDVSADSSSLSYFWDFGDAETSNEQNPKHTYSQNGTYTVTLTVTDKDGGVGTIYNTHSWISDTVPTANFTFDTGKYEGEEISFTDLSTAYDGIVSWSWDLGDGNTSTDQNPKHTYSQNGTYTVTLTVTDGDGSTDSVPYSVNVADLGPTASVCGASSLWEGELGEWDACGSTSYPDEIVSYEWDWNYDGSFDASGDTGSMQNHTYNYDGTYMVAVKVTDEDGSSDIANMSVEVKNYVPYFVNLPASVNTAIGDNFEFDVDANDSSPADTLSYSISGNCSWMSINSSTGVITGSSTERGVCVEYVNVSDGTDSNQSTLTVNVYDYSIHLDAGWNLISIPFVTEDNSINFVFSTILNDVAYEGDDVATILQYDAVDDEWSKARPESDYSGFGWNVASSELGEIVPGYGYWIKMANESTIYLNSKEFEVGQYPEPSVDVASHSWNLVGRYGVSSTGLSTIDAFESLEGYVFENSLKGYNGADLSYMSSLETGKGYWVRTKIFPEQVQGVLPYGPVSEASQ